MRHQPVCLKPDYNMMTEIVLRCVGNLIVIGALPFRLGQMGAPFWYLPIYAIVAGIILTVAKDIRYAQGMFLRVDVRSYTRVRVALIAVFGATPFLAGMTLH